MQIKAILFDLDGTLLPMDQEIFINDYLKRLSIYLAHYGYDPKKLVDGIWQGTGAMVKNDGSRVNEDAFWDAFCAVYGKNAREDIALFDEFYRTDFQNVKDVCGYTPKSAEVIAEIKALGYRVALATNPIFPSVATESRMRWAGLQPQDFEVYTTYENSYHSKPNPDYYREVAEKMGLAPEECLMVGNDAVEDMMADTIGMKVFLLTDWMINTKNIDISAYPHGSFDELMEFVRGL